MPLVGALWLAERGFVTCDVEYVVDNLKKHPEFRRKATESLAEAGGDTGDLRQIADYIFTRNE